MTRLAMMLLIAVLLIVLWVLDGGLGYLIAAGAFGGLGLWFWWVLFGRLEPDFQAQMKRLDDDDPMDWRK